MEVVKTYFVKTPKGFWNGGDIVKVYELASGTFVIECLATAGGIFTYGVISRKDFEAMRVNPL